MGLAPFWLFTQAACAYTWFIRDFLLVCYAVYIEMFLFYLAYRSSITPKFS